MMYHRRSVTPAPQVQCCPARCTHKSKNPNLPTWCSLSTLNLGAKGVPAFVWRACDSAGNAAKVLLNCYRQQFPLNIAASTTLGTTGHQIMACMMQCRYTYVYVLPMRLMLATPRPLCTNPGCKSFGPNARPRMGGRWNTAGARRTHAGPPRRSRDGAAHTA